MVVGGVVEVGIFVDWGLAVIIVIVGWVVAGLGVIWFDIFFV